MINGFKIRQLSNNEYSQYIWHVLKLIKDNPAIHSMVKKEYSALEEVFDLMENQFQVQARNPLTKEMVAMDVKRDNTVTAIRAHLTGYLYDDDPQIKIYAKRLLRKIDRFGKVQKDNYASETSKIGLIISAWETQPELAEAITALNLQRLKEKLKAANEAFENLRFTRSINNGSKPSGDIKPTRLLINKAYYTLRDRLNALEIVSDDPAPVRLLGRALNVMIEDCKASIKRKERKVKIKN